MATVADRRYRNPQLSFGGPSGLGRAVTARKFFDATGRVDELLFAGEKRMTRRANADLHVAPRRTRVINRAARADDVGLVVLRMNVRFHSRLGARNVAD